WPFWKAIEETEKTAGIFRERFLRSGLDNRKVIPPQPFHPLPAPLLTVTRNLRFERRMPNALH
ncbi:MAG: hypothetical protein K2L38_07790, partial [Dysosmobacter sp.]|nr:hypothetical protein [Dysosmobacter sp.]